MTVDPAAAVTIDARLRRWLLWSAAALLVLCGSTALVLDLRGISGVPAYYFHAQDALLLLVGAAALLFAPRLLTARWQPRLALTGVQAGALTGLAAIFAYAGADLILLRYPMSRDESLAQFAGQYLARGQFGWAIPAGLRDIARPLMPVWADGWSTAGYWTSSYLPVNSALRAVGIWLGDAWLTGPLLLGIGLGATWASARRLWPDHREAATVVLILALTSSQLLVTAMSAYAMTAHFALNALWLVCFLRGGRTGHGLAILIGLFATGLHQLHFHMMFVSGFIVWLWLAGQRRTALCYIAACVAYVAVWQIGYAGHLLPYAFGTQPPAASHAAVATPFYTHLLRLRELEPFSSLARFLAWQNVLLLPLAAMGMVPFRRPIRGDGGPPPLALAFQISCLFGLALMPYQGFGYGYRYLHGMLPCFLMLAGGGWVRVAAMRPGRAPTALVIGSAILAGGVTVPFTAWRSHALLAPYARAFAVARAAPADVVAVDARGAGFLQDIIRIDARIDRPLLLDLAYIPRPVLAQLCRTRRVMLFDGHQAHALGVQGTGVGDQPGYPALAAARRGDLARWRCDTPVPLASTPG